MHRWSLHWLTAFSLSFAATGLHAQTSAAAAPDYFETKVRPVLAGNCYGCHGDSKMGGLRVDSLDGLLKGGTHGPAVVPGDPDKSLLIKAVRQTDAGLKMPMGAGKLKDADITALVEWVKAGAKWPKVEASTANAAKDGDKYVIAPEQKKFWSFLPLQDPKPPAVKDTKWAATDIDRFVLAKLEKEGLKPVHLASRRRPDPAGDVRFDGTAATVEEIEAFEKDKSPDAFAKVVDRLLASPHYGERWGRYWLDVARYGEDDYRSLNPNPRGYYPYAERLSVSRLGDPGVQRRYAV